MQSVTGTVNKKLTRERALTLAAARKLDTYVAEKMDCRMLPHCKISENYW